MGRQLLVLHLDAARKRADEGASTAPEIALPAGGLSLAYTGLQELAGDNRPNEELVCPEATAGLWSTITFSWVSDLMKKGYKCAPPVQGVPAL